MFNLLLVALAALSAGAVGALATVRVPDLARVVAHGGALMHKVHGDKAWEMPPMRRIQDSGIHWGLGSDATAVTTSNPFYTLWFAVTGKMIGGRKVNRQTITREEALIAHTRNNAQFLFREGDLGSIQKGKYADLLVLDRDYLTVAADSIKDLRPVLTLVGGRIVYDGKKM